jgi:polar amino acid transport system permease protein
VQLLWVNYVWPEIFGFPQTVTGAGIIALALQSSGYLAETFRSGFDGLPKGQREAAAAVGMSRWRVLYRIELPQVALVAMPLVINQLAVIVKSSTLVSVIAISDLMYQGLKIVNQWYEPIEVLTAIALAYFLLIFSISRVANAVYVHFQAKFGIAGYR